MAAAIRYRRPETLAEAVDLLAADDMAKVLAGGQSLIPMISLGLARPGQLIDIGRVRDAPQTSVNRGLVRIGMLTRHAELEAAHGALADAAPILPATARWIGHAAIRSRGTFIGSLAHGDPAAEWPAVALLLDAELEVRSPRGTRSIPASEFFLGPLTTAVDPDEIVVAASWTAAARGSVAVTLELTMRHGDYAIVGVAAQVTPGGASGIQDARIALFGVGQTPIRASESEAALVARGVAALADAGSLASDASDPFSDVSASADYRRRMISVYVQRAVLQALGGDTASR